MLSHSDVPTLVDFGFANKWPLGERGSFLSDISWGTPEVCFFSMVGRGLMGSTSTPSELKVCLTMNGLQTFGPWA